MLLTHVTQTTFGPLQPAEVCVEFALVLLEEHLAELEHRAKSAQRTIGQLIRHSIGLYLAGVRDRCEDDGMWDTSHFDAQSDSATTLDVTLLLPISRIRELKSLAVRYDTTAGELIRRVICYSLFGYPTRKQPPNES